MTNNEIQQEIWAAYDNARIDLDEPDANPQEIIKELKEAIDFIYIKISE